MLEAGSRNSILQSVRLLLVGQQAVDQAAGEGVAAANAVNDIGDLVLAGDVELLAVVDAGSPVVAVRALAKRICLYTWSIQRAPENEKKPGINK